MFSYLLVHNPLLPNPHMALELHTHTHTACFTCHQTWHRMALLQQNNRCRCAQKEEPSRMMLLFSCTVSSASCFVPVWPLISGAASGTAVSPGSVLKARPVPSESRVCVPSHPSTVSLVWGFSVFISCPVFVALRRFAKPDGFLLPPSWVGGLCGPGWCGLKGSGSHRRRRRLHKLLPLVCINTVQLFGLRNVSATFQHLQVDASRCVWCSDPAWLFPTPM